MIHYLFGTCITRRKHCCHGYLEMPSQQKCSSRTQKSKIVLWRLGVLMCSENTAHMRIQPLPACFRLNVLPGARIFVGNRRIRIRTSRRCVGPENVIRQFINFLLFFIGSILTFMGPLQELLRG